MGYFSVVVLLAAALGVMLLTMRRSSTGARVVRWGRVTGIVGRKGHGKSLFAVHELLRTIGHPQVCKKCSEETGSKVVHRQSIAFNGTLRVGDESLQPLVHSIGCWDDLYGLPHSCLVVIDEIGMHGWAPSSGQVLPPRATHMLGQCRKYGLEIVWIAQHEARTSVGLRNQTDEMGMCKRGFFRAMKVNFFEPENLRAKEAKPVWTFRYRVTKRVSAAYNTFEFIESTAVEDSASATRGRATKSSGLGSSTEVPVSGIPKWGRLPDKTAQQH